jgi:WD40 repeat protein
VVASASDDGTVCLWDSASGELMTRLPGHEHPIMRVSFSLDGSLLATGDKSGTVLLWDLLPVMETNEEGKKQCSIQ